MAQILGTYTQIDSPVQRADVRLKLIFLVAYSIALFLGHAWLALGLFAALFVAVILFAKIPFVSFAKSLVPLYAMLVFVMIFNAFEFSDIAGRSSSDVLFAVGSCLFLKSGLLRGLYYSLRIILLVGMSMVICSSCTTKELADTLSLLFGPLSRFGFPAQDASMVVALALRFIPLMSEQLSQIRDAQASRGARFAEGGLFARLKAWSNAMIPLFVGMFRRADNLALALDARCYGATPATSRGMIAGPTKKEPAPVSSAHKLLCFAVCVFVLAVGVVL